MADIAHLRQLLRYDPETGNFYWIVTGRGHALNAIAGTRHGNGYLRITVAGERIFAHRLAWFFARGEMPTDDVDHINGNRSDNRICNLRLASRYQNLGNTRARKTSASGVKGVTFVRKTGRFRAVITVNGKQNHLGYFNTAEEASDAYRSAAQSAYGEFARAS